MEQRILIVDDEIKIRTILKHLLTEEGYQVRTAENGYKGLQLSREFQPHLILMDQNMPGMNGLDASKKIKEHYPQQTIVILTAYGSVSSAVEAIKNGVYDYLEKPFDNEKLLLLIRRALHHSHLTSELKQYKETMANNHSFNNVVGQSRPLLQLLNQVKCVSKTDATILLQGESGVGKDVIANAIHYNSARKKHPMVAINCGALPLHLIESELFGHEKGTFTDAKETKIGKFEQAHDSTLFLDEVGELPLEAQVKLLRVLEEKKVTRLGGKKAIPVNVRIISASNRNLEEQVQQGKFRLDLYYRLNIFSMVVPTLRERKEDIPLLIEHFIGKHNTELGLQVTSISEKAMEYLQNFNWPGNIRDLQNAIQSAMILAQEGIITEDHLPLRVRGYSTLEEEKLLEEVGLEGKIRVINQRMEKQLILEALRQCNYNRTEAANLLKISRKTLFNKMKLYDLG